MSRRFTQVKAQAGKPRPACIPNPFSKSTSKTDLVLLVEDQRLHVSRAVMSIASPVFEAMLTGDYKEKDMQEIPLPGKQHMDMLQFLRCIYPSILEQISGQNLDSVLPLADEYQVLPLKERCEAYMLTWIKNIVPSTDSNKVQEQVLHFLYLANTYKLTNTLDAACVDSLKCRSLQSVVSTKDFSQLSTDMTIRLLKERLLLLESYAQMVCNEYTYDIKASVQELKSNCYE